jgi:hypothetical protein
MSRDTNTNDAVPTLSELLNMLNDRTKTLEERLAIYNDAYARREAAATAWENQGKPRCPTCTKPHANECLLGEEESKLTHRVPRFVMELKQMATARKAADSKDKRKHDGEEDEEAASQTPPKKRKPAE